MAGKYITCPTCKKEIPRSSSGYYGVYPRVNKEIGTINFIVKVAGDYVGCYQDPVTAAEAYDAEAKSRYGECAKLNFPASR